jgi:ATP-binding cassette subfamily G (WHITE) protein 2
VSDTTGPDKQQDEHVDYLRNAYAKSTVFTEIKKQTTDLGSSVNSATASTVNKAELPKKSRLTEIFYVAQRTFRNAFRNPALIGMQIGVSIFLGVLIGLIYLKTDRSLDTGLKNRLGVIFFMVTNQVFGSLSALDLFIKERPLFQHENVSGYYHVSTYFIAKLICDILPLRTIPSIFFSVIAYFMIGFQRTVAKFFIFFFGIYATSLCASSLCFVVSASVQVFGKRFISLKSS